MFFKIPAALPPHLAVFVSESWASGLEVGPLALVPSPHLWTHNDPRGAELLEVVVLISSCPTHGLGVVKGFEGITAAQALLILLSASHWNMCLQRQKKFDTWRCLYVFSISLSY